MPQELSTDAFESVWATVSFSRGLFGKPPDKAVIERILRDLSAQVGARATEALFDQRLRIANQRLYLGITFKRLSLD